MKVSIHPIPLGVDHCYIIQGERWFIRPDCGMDPLFIYPNQPMSWVPWLSAFIILIHSDSLLFICIYTQ